MIWFLLKRLLLVPVTVWLIGSVVFLLSSIIPGTFADRQLENNELSGSARQRVVSVNQEENKIPLFYASLSPNLRADTYGLPQLNWYGTNNRYHQWLSQLIYLNTGYSYRDGRPVSQILGEALGNTFILVVTSLLIIFWGSIKISQLLVAKNKVGQRSVFLSFLYVIDSIPLFIIALSLLTFLAGSGFLKLFPVFGLGMTVASDNLFLTLVNYCHHLILPLFCLVLAGLPYVTAQLYKVMQNVVTSNFILTARAKGLPEKLVLQRHVFRNSLLPLITLFTGYLPVLISGAIVIEIIFAIPGTGRLLAESILARDYPVVIGIVLVLAATKVFSHLLADLLYFAADPRTRLKTA